VEIPHNAKLPDILWKLRRVCRNGTPSNPHFYPDTAFGEVITEILPLRDRNVNKHDEKWTERIFVYGDNTEGRIRLTSQDETIVRLFGAVERCLVRPPERPLTLFKGLVASRTIPWCSHGLRRYRGAPVSGGRSRSIIFEGLQSQMLPMAGFLFRDRP